MSNTLTEVPAPPDAPETPLERTIREEQEAHDKAAAANGGEPDGEKADAPEEPRPPKLLQEALPGDWDTISSDFGGAEPTESEIRLLGGKMAIEGSFDKGTEFDILVRVKVTGVLGQDVTDDYGRTTRTVRRHMARMISVRRANR